jgi:O-antigen ligase
MENTNRKDKFKKLMLLIALIFVFLIYFNLASVYSALAVVFLILGYVFFKNYLWIFLIAAIPALAFGQIINIPVTTNWVYEVTVSEILIIFCFAIFIFDKFFNQKIKEIKFNKLFLIFLFYLALTTISLINVINFHLYVFELKIVGFSVLAYFLSINLLTEKKKIRWFLYSLAGLALILSAQIFVEFYSMGWSTKFFFDRNNIIFPFGPLALVSASLAMILPLIITDYFSLHHQSQYKPLAFFVSALGILAIFLTLGKTAILSFFIALLYLFIKLKNKRIIFILSFCLFLILSFIFFTSFFSGLIERVGYVFADANTQYRVLEYQTSGTIIKDHWFYGIGAGQQLYYFKKMLNFDTSQLVDNFFLQSLIGLGLVGLLVLFALTREFFKQVTRIAKGARRQIIIFGFVASFIVAFLNGLFEVTFFTISYAVVFWIMAGVFSNLEFINE